jgi:hypothetical protein
MDTGPDRPGFRRIRIDANGASETIFHPPGRPSGDARMKDKE